MATSAELPALDEARTESLTMAVSSSQYYRTEAGAIVGLRFADGAVKRGAPGTPLAAISGGVGRRNVNVALTFIAGLAAGAAGIYLGGGPRVVPALASVKPPAVAPQVEIHVFDRDLTALLRRPLLFPLAHVDPALLEDTFSDPRPGRKMHEALDIPAKRGTPIRAATDGAIVRLTSASKGGISIYEIDAEGEYCYVYAHLDRYANHLKTGLRVKRGDIIGYVGSTGDAPASSPHLHFAILRIRPGEELLDGAPVDPYPLFAGAARGIAADD